MQYSKLLDQFKNIGIKNAQSFGYSIKTLFKAPESPKINAPFTVVMDSKVFRLLVKHNL